MSKVIPGSGGDRYIPACERAGAKSAVYFTRDLSAEGLLKAYAKIASRLSGKVGIKLHTGEPHGPNIIPRPWVEKLVKEQLPDAAIVETNTYYDGDRYTTEDHLKTIATNGWTFCPVDIMDAKGSLPFPVKGGKWFTEVEMGKNLANYDSLLVLTHFKGHSKGGFGGSNKNIGIGCAGGQTGKKAIHTTPGSDDMWDISRVIPTCAVTGEAAGTAAALAAALPEESLAALSADALQETLRKNGVRLHIAEIL